MLRSLLEPMAGVTAVPGTDSWGERYGPIGVVAALALTALALALRQFWVDRKADRARADEIQKELDKRVAALNEKIVEVVREGQRELLQRLHDQQTANDARYHALLDRTMSENKSNADALRAQNSAVTDALNGVVKKLSRGAD